MTASENQFSTLDSAWCDTPIQVRPPQDSQQLSSSFLTLRHSQHCFDISQIMSNAPQPSYPPN